MKKNIALSVLLLLTIAVYTQVPWTQRTFCRITLDTKLMNAPSCSLGGGGGYASTHEKVYAHLGLCSCSITNNERNCSNENDNELFCISQITPYQSQVWQHVVGNWGDYADDDGVGLMQNLGNGVYQMEFIIEDYFSSSQVSTQQTVSSAVPSQPWNVNLGGKPYTIGMVFRNADGTSSGRDDQCNDLFIVQILNNPMVVQSSDPDGPVFSAINVEVTDASIDQIMMLSHSTQIFPNPAQEIFSVKFKLVAPSSNVVIDIYDILGKKIKSEKYNNKKDGWHTLNFNTENYENGLYLISISINDYKVHTQRLLIKK